MMNEIMSMNAGDVMTNQPICSYPDMIMTEVAEIFENNSFHHLPVIDSSGVCIGMISKSDYFQLQDKFTKFGAEKSVKGNDRFFAALLASEVMTPFPATVDKSTSLNQIIDIFLKNKIRSIAVNESNKFRGIITPYDILQILSASSKKEQKCQEV